MNINMPHRRISTRALFVIRCFAIPCFAGTLLAQTPTVTSVSPNPISVGTVTVTITGTGFLPGAAVYDSYGTQSLIQTGASTVTPTSLTATVYQGAASTSTFSVKNPGSAFSNAITVPVTSSGSGGGSSSNAPVLTSVSPNPINVGTVTVTITGTGFQTGAAVYDSYGAQSLIQYSSSNVTPTSLTATIYQGAAATSTFSVKNPGSAFSNAITVPITSSGSGGTGGGGGGSTSYTLTLVNGTVTNPTTPGPYAAGTVVSIVANTPPAGQAFQSWGGALVTSFTANATTFTMPAANTTVTAYFYTPTPIPFPVTTHPRLWITQGDVPRLQNYALSNGVVYKGLTGALTTAIANYNLAFPGAGLGATNPTPASPYPDFGDSQGYTGILSEENAVILAFNSLIDPNLSNRPLYAQAARNLLMYAMNQAALGQAKNLPFRDPNFILYNRGSFTGHEWALIVDWIYNATNNGAPILTVADKATIRTVFMTWAADCLTASTTGGDNPGTPGLVNSLSLLPHNLPYRMASNNYFLAHARLLTMISLVLDPSDDAPLNANLPGAALGNTLRSYITDATGAWLYEEFAMMGDPQTVAQAYNVPGNPTGAGFGLASGGLPPEGTLYGDSFAYILGQLLALQTSGFNTVANSGPQIQLIGAPVWDRYITGYISSLTPTPMVPPLEAYLGSVFLIAGYGDMLRLWVTPDQMAPPALLGLLDQQTGVSTHVNAARWFALNAMPSGQSGLLGRMTNPWTWGVTQDLLYFMLLDPTAAAPTDPRPTFPTLFYDAPAGRIVAHSDWSPSGTMFDYRASWISINHQDGASGQFGLFRKGEFLTKEMSNYDAGGVGNGATSTYHNSLALQNYCSACSTINWQGPELPAWKNGSQWMEGEGAGDPSTAMSSGPGYVYAASNLTNLYNRPNLFIPQNSVVNVTQATRSILWLNNDYIVVYDRATSLNAGLFKRFNLSLVASPIVSGNTVTDTLPSGQQLFVQTLLPLNASISGFSGVAVLNPIADLEPTRFILQVQDPTSPTDTRFLHVLQGADPGAAMASASYLQSSSGTSFDGTAFGATAVYFPVTANTTFATSTLPAPAGVHVMLVAGLTPNAAYAYTVQPSGSGNLITLSSSSAGAVADSAGLLRITF